MVSIRPILADEAIKKKKGGGGGDLVNFFMYTLSL